MHLVEDSGIHLDSSLATYVDGVPESWDKITLRHLLTHTSGIGGKPCSIYDLRKDYTEDELLDIAFSVPLRFPSLATRGST